jgi:hypothetical protein
MCDLWYAALVRCGCRARRAGCGPCTRARPPPVGGKSARPQNPGVQLLRKQAAVAMRTGSRSGRRPCSQRPTVLSAAGNALGDSDAEHCFSASGPRARAHRSRRRPTPLSGREAIRSRQSFFRRRLKRSRSSRAALASAWIAECPLLPRSAPVRSAVPRPQDCPLVDDPVRGVSSEYDLDDAPSPGSCLSKTLDRCARPAERNHDGAEAVLSDRPWPPTMTTHRVGRCAAPAGRSVRVRRRRTQSTIWTWLPRSMPNAGHCPLLARPEPDFLVLVQLPHSVSRDQPAIAASFMSAGWRDPERATRARP